MIKPLDREEIQKYRESKVKPTQERKHWSELVESNPFTRLAVEETKRRNETKEETNEEDKKESISSIPNPSLPQQLKPENEVDTYKEIFKRIRKAINNIQL